MSQEPPVPPLLELLRTSLVMREAEDIIEERILRLEESPALHLRVGKHLLGKLVASQG